MVYYLTAGICKWLLTLLSNKSRHLDILFAVFSIPVSGSVGQSQYHGRVLAVDSSSTFEHLLEAVLAIRIRLFQVVFLLVQIGHLLVQRFTLILESLLYIWDRCADKPKSQRLVSPLLLIFPRSCEGANVVA